jgi:hypothetical protein
MVVDLSRNPTKFKTSVALPVDVREEARKVAAHHGISLSEYLVRLLRADLSIRKIEQKESI